MSVETYQLNFYVFICAYHLEISSFFGKSFLFLLLFLSNLILKLQIKGKESENSYQELKRSRKGLAHTNTRKLNRDISTGTAVFLNQESECL